MQFPCLSPGFSLASFTDTHVVPFVALYLADLLTDMCLTSPGGHRLTGWGLRTKAQVVEEAHGFAIPFLQQLC